MRGVANKSGTQYKREVVASIVGGIDILTPPNNVIIESGGLGSFSLELEGVISDEELPYLTLCEWTENAGPVIVGAIPTPSVQRFPYWEIPDNDAPFTFTFRRVTRPGYYEWEDITGVDRLVRTRIAQATDTKFMLSVDHVGTSLTSQGFSGTLRRASDDSQVHFQNWGTPRTAGMGPLLNHFVSADMPDPPANGEDVYMDMTLAGTGGGDFQTTPFTWGDDLAAGEYGEYSETYEAIRSELP